MSEMNKYYKTYANIFEAAKVFRVSLEKLQTGFYFIKTDCFYCVYFGNLFCKWAFLFDIAPWIHKWHLSKSTYWVLFYNTFLIKSEEHCKKKSKNKNQKIQEARIRIPILVIILLLQNNGNSGQVIYFLKKIRKWIKLTNNQIGLCLIFPYL